MVVYRDFTGKELEIHYSKEFQKKYCNNCKIDCIFTMGKKDECNNYTPEDGG